jgi:cyclopropane-fatty-acyl-phospholipid synthase
MTTAIAATPETKDTVALLSRLFPDAALGNVSFALWDGSTWPDDKPRAATIVLHHPGTVRAMFSEGTEKGLAEAFLRDDFDVTGDIEAACELADVLAETRHGGWLKAAKTLFRLRVSRVKPVRNRTSHVAGANHAREHSLERDRRAIAFHYDVSNDFFRLWLDARMVYSCAYFERPDIGLGEAQGAKFRHICRKLRLQPRQRVLDIGCGWGGFSIFAAEQYGVRVTGVTLSEQQASLAATLVKEAGLAERVDIQLKDYREIAPEERYDAILSVGMAEHVGSEHLEEYFKRVLGYLKPGGVFLNHAIGEGVRARGSHGPSFIQEYVFPDSDIPPLPRVLAAAESAGFEVRDVENLREHYLLTLRHWVRRLEEAHEAALKFVDESTYRVWRLYMAGSAHGFKIGRLAVYQTLLVKPDHDGKSHLPLTRRDWYEAKA